MITKPQAHALAKWRHGKPENEKALKVRENVYDNLRKMGFLQTTSFLMRVITEDGQAALKEYEAKHGPIQFDKYGRPLK